ncbi:MAG: ABC transporter permease subunit [Alphaproteobacteria bacterium]
MIEIFLDYFWAARINLYYAGLSLPLGFIFAIFLAIGLTGDNKLTQRMSSGFVYVFRGSPLFIQLYLFYYAVRATGWPGYRPPGSFDRPYDFLLDALVLAPVVLLLNTAAYSAIIFANALRAVPRGDIEAADAFGFSARKKFWRITWPTMLRIAWPAYTNEAIFLFLSTALVYASIPVTTRPGGANYKDVLVTANDIMEKSFNPFAAYLPAMAVFVVLTLIIFFFFGLVNAHLNRHLVRVGDRPRLSFRPNFIR